MELGRKIRARREGRGLTQAELARMAGISQGHLANLEAGRRTPRLAVLERLARALEISPGELMAPDCRED